jgi:hypothetical protein
VKRRSPLRSAALLAVGCAACGSSSGSSARTDGGTTSSLEAGPDPPVPERDASCGDIETDPDNCGGCGIRCDGGLCVGGVCSAPFPSVLVSGQVTPRGIVIDDLNVYWIEQGVPQPSGANRVTQVMKCAKSGCGNMPAVLASGSWAGATRLALNGDTLYWATQNQVLSCATAGCPTGPTVLSTSALTPTDIAVDTTGIYVGDSNQNELLMFPLAGSMSPTVLWRSPAVVATLDGGVVSASMSSYSPPLAIALDGATAYFGTTGVSLVSCSPTGCANLVVGGTPTSVDVAGGVVYVGTQAQQSPGAIASCPEANCTAGLTLLTTRLSYCAGMAVDATSVYFTDLGSSGSEGGTIFSGSGRVEKCPIAGCRGNPTLVAAFVNFPQQIAVDDTSVYWTDFGSSTDPNATEDGRVMTALK